LRIETGTCGLRTNRPIFRSRNDRFAEKLHDGMIGWLSRANAVRQEPTGIVGPVDDLAV
jgi:hypothetical protein